VTEKHPLPHQKFI